MHTAIEAKFDESLEQPFGFVSPVKMELFEGVAVKDRGLGGAKQGHDLGWVADEGGGVSQVEIRHDDDGRFERIKPTGWDRIHAQANSRDRRVRTRKRANLRWSACARRRFAWIELFFL